MMQEDRMQNSEFGYQKVYVSEANGTIPVRGAVVTITDYGEENDALYTLRTGPGGTTETVPLPVPAASESLTPGGKQPYALYGITVTADGFYPVEYAALPLFAGVTSVLNVNLIPLSEEDARPGAAGRVILYETPATESLQPGGLRREDIGQSNGILSGGVEGWEL